jgi:hypothetical protein
MYEQEYNSEEEDMQIIMNHCAQLSEHFETVQIFVTKLCKKEDGTINAQYGEGNWFARYGQIRQWVIKEEKSFKNIEEEND